MNPEVDPFGITTLLVIEIGLPVVVPNEFVKFIVTSESTGKVATA